MGKISLFIDGTEIPGREEGMSVLEASLGRGHLYPASVFPSRSACHRRM